MRVNLVKLGSVQMKPCGTRWILDRIKFVSGEESLTIDRFLESPVSKAWPVKISKVR